MEKAFQLLPAAEREAVISHGVALRLSDLRKRLFLAESKVRQFEEKYGTTLNRIEEEGLPDQADINMHEDYIMWRHWFGVAERTRSASPTSNVRTDYPQITPSAAPAMAGRQISKDFKKKRQEIGTRIYTNQHEKGFIRD